MYQIRILLYFFFVSFHLLPLCAEEETCGIRLTDQSVSPVIALANKYMQVVIAPELGGKVVSLKDHDGFEYISRSVRDYRPRSRSVKYAQTEFDGIDECFPLLETGDVNPEGWTDYETLPDHGLLFNHKWDVLQKTEDRIIMQVSPEGMPFKLIRTAEIRDNALILKYALSNISDKKFPYMYIFHPLFKAVNGVKVLLTDDTIVKLMYSNNRFLGVGGTYKKWGTFKNDHGALFKENQYVLKSEQWYKYVFDAPESSEVGLLYPTGQQLRLVFDQTFFSYVAVWASCGTAGGLEHIGIEPVTNDIDSLHECVKNKTAKWLAAGETVSWYIRIIICSQGCKGQKNAQ